MNASIFSLLLAAAPLPGVVAQGLGFDGYDTRALPAAAPPIPMQVPLRARSNATDATAVPQARVDRTTAPFLQAPDAAILFMKDTRYTLG